MRNIISTFLVLSFIAIFGTISVFAQDGTRVDADIPFEFTVGKTTFAPGKYRMVLTSVNGSVYNVSLFDAGRKRIFNTIAVRNPSTNRHRSEMVFAVAESGHLLETIRTPEMGFRFMGSKRDVLVAHSKTVAVPASGSPNF